ncbi:MAG: hypothetical protein AAGJ19_22325 [Myxococcota bacterium]
MGVSRAEVTGNYCDIIVSSGFASVGCLFDGPDLFTNNEVFTIEFFDLDGESCAEVTFDVVAEGCNARFNYEVPVEQHSCELI